ncbi:TPA: phosphonate metabolism transcriptional regulator PhnF [Klebsiella variicola subsp. variicola]
MHLSRHPTSYPTRYQEIAARLEQELRHHYRCGDYLPAEQQLATRFDVNRHTLRRAIDQLVERGWVQRRQGVGVLVLMRPIDYPLNAQARFSQNLLEQGSDPTSEKLLSVLRPASEKLLSVLRPASAHVAEAFGINEGENVIHLRTLRRVNGVALCLIDHYFADLRFWPVLQTFSHGSLHDLLRDELDVKLTRARTKISARRAQAKESKLLEIPNMAPLLCVRTLNSRQGEQTPIEYSVSLTRADMIEFTMEH